MSQQARVHTTDPQRLLQSEAEGTSNFKTQTSPAMVLSVAGEAGVHPSASCPAAGGRAWGFSWGGELRRKPVGTRLLSCSWLGAWSWLGSHHLSGQRSQDSGLSHRGVELGQGRWLPSHALEELLGPKHPLKKLRKGPR